MESDQRQEPESQLTRQDPRRETLAQRDDRNLVELIQELRVLGLGVQVLFGFLLSLPFTVFLVTGYVAGALTGALITGLAGVMLCALWFALPLTRRAAGGAGRRG